MTTSSDFYEWVRQMPHEEYCRRFLKILTKAKKLEPFVFNNAQREAMEMIEDQRRRLGYVRLIVLKARQIGISTLIESLIFREYSTRPGTNASIISYRNESAISMKDMFERYYNNLPAELKPELRRSNERALEYADWDSKIKIWSAKDDDIVVGDTMAYMHLTEAALWPNFNKTLDAILPSVPDVPGSIVCIETTARGFNEFKEMWDKAVRKEIDYLPLFLPWFKDEKYAIHIGDELGKLDSEEQALVNKFALSDAQLRFRRKIFKDVCRNNINTLHQEYPATPEEAFISTGSCYFDLQLCNNMIKKCPPPIAKGFLDRRNGPNGEEIVFRPDDNGALWIWKWPSTDKNQRLECFIGADVAGARMVDEGKKEGDKSSATVMSTKPIDLCASLLYNAYEDEYAEDLINLGLFYGMAWIAPEVNGLGRVVSLKLKNRYRRLWTMERHDNWEEEIEGYPGWKTDKSSRPYLLSDLNEMMRTHPEAFKDSRLWSQAVNFVQKKNGRWEAAGGCHDDIIFSTGIAVQMIQSMKSSSITSSNPIGTGERKLQVGSIVYDYETGTFQTVPDKPRTGNIIRSGRQSRAS